MELEVLVGLPEVSAEFAVRKWGPAEEPEVAGVEVAEEFAGELAVEPGVELVADQSAESVVGSAEDLEVVHLD